jgi:NADH-quinone oxidoreductase subunit E
VSLPTNADAGRQIFRTSVIQLDRPGDPSVFGPQTRAEAAQIIGRYPVGQSRSALLPLLHLVQSEQGYVTADGIAFCAEVLNITKAQVSAVVTFYTMYKRHPTGEYLVSVCTNTLCGMLGGDEILAGLRETLDVEKDGETTADGLITLEHAECLAACDYAPVVTVNYECFDNQTLDSAESLVGSLRAGQRPLPSRGAPLCSFKQIERQIAGFFDAETLAQDSISSGDPTEVGVRLAIERGDTAPSYAAGSATSDPARPGRDKPSSQPTSSHDAPLETSQSDDAHTHAPEGDAGSEPGSASTDGKQ